MSTPPPPGWQPQQPPHNAPQYGSQPGNFPPGGYPQGPLPPRGSNATKWLLLAIAVLLTVGVVIGATLLFNRNSSSMSPSEPTGASGLASANDTGPVSIIADDPTCDAYTGINNAIASVQGNGWSASRDSLGPKSEWTPSQQQQVDAVTTVISNSADQVVGLAKQTPHRVVRELYEQFIAYGRAYVESVANYTPADNYLASANISAGRALMSLCSAISFGSTNRSLAVPKVAEPTEVPALNDATNPTRFLDDKNKACSAWIARDQRFSEDTAAWQNSDSNVNADQWTPDQRAIQLAALPKISALANDLQTMGDSSSNPTFSDFATSAALYLRAYVSSGDSYTTADSYLASTGFRFSNVITAACQTEPV